MTRSRYILWQSPDDFDTSLPRIGKGTAMTYDVIVVGAGSAGCALAARLGKPASFGVAAGSGT